MKFYWKMLVDNRPGADSQKRIVLHVHLETGYDGRVEKEMFKNEKLVLALENFEEKIRKFGWDKAKEICFEKGTFSLDDVPAEIKPARVTIAPKSKTKSKKNSGKSSKEEDSSLAGPGDGEGEEV